MYPTLDAVGCGNEKHRLSLKKLCGCPGVREIARFCKPRATPAVIQEALRAHRRHLVPLSKPVKPRTPSPYPRA